MSIDWSLVSIDHVRVACEHFDSGAAAPRRSAKTTFLSFQGRKYPAKFIRGSAFRLATGIELSSEEYSGGEETVRFFSTLGLTATIEPSGTDSNSTVPSNESGDGTSDPVEVRRIALVSHDYNSADSRGLFDYSEHFERINRICDDRGCDTVLYALWTWDLTSSAGKSHSAIFSTLRNVRRIILEVYEPPERFDHVEIWQRETQHPVVALQRFSTSSASEESKKQFVEDIECRRVGSALLMICGETNIASMIRGSNDFYDPFSFADILDASGVRLILNPIHDYMRRYEMKEKRRFYSRNGRTVVSVWNKGKGKESWLPWTVFHDGNDVTEQVDELPEPIPERTDIRIGIFEMAYHT